MSRILILEDEPLIASLLEEWFIENGHVQIKVAMSVTDGLATVQTTPIDLAIVDINLQGEECYQVADELAARQIPFVFSTGYAPKSIAPRFALRPTVFKPFDFAQLSKMVDGLLAPPRV